MSLEQGFLQAVLDNPDDDGPRLVYADWLDEHGDADRAEFIRVQIEGGRPGVDEGERARCWAREQELLGRHEERWVAPLRPWVREWRFERGFVERVRVRADEAAGAGRHVFHLAPIRHARFNDAAAHLGALLALPELGRLRSLDLSHNLLGPSHMHMLAEASTLGKLSALDLASNPLGNAGGVNLAKAALASLTALTLYCTDLRSIGVAALVRSPGAATLERLDLAWTTPGLGGVAELMVSPHLGRLRSLSLRGCRIKDAGAELLASGRLGGLEELDLSHNAIGDAGARNLAEVVAEGRLRLRSLDLSLNPVADERPLAMLRGLLGFGFSFSRGRSPGLLPAPSPVPSERRGLSPPSSK